MPSDLLTICRYMIIVLDDSVCSLTKALARGLDNVATRDPHSVKHIIAYYVALSYVCRFSCADALANIQYMYLIADYFAIFLKLTEFHYFFLL